MPLHPSPAPLLRFALLADALTSGATGIFLAVCSHPLANLLGLHQTLLWQAGLALCPFAIFVGWLSRRETLNPAGVWATIALNGLWVVGSFALLLSDWIHPTALGIAFVVAQAVIVAIFAELQLIGLSRFRHSTKGSA